MLNKKKIVNDPVHGFIHFPSGKVFDVVEHPWFQRLRRIKQLGLTDMVYPGARHTRFHHALGATYLMSLALDVLSGKGQELTPAECEAAYLAILLHDIGHGPFSHSLERHIINVSHEDVSLIFMEALNQQFKGELTTAIDIFTNQYPKRFLHQLVSGQLDVDRLDYLRRDSFFTGVSEGIVSSDRIIKMLDVANDQLVVELKGIYSIEKFLIARRLMYWQVYLHKTVHAAEQLLQNILKRAKYLAQNGVDLFATPAFRHFLYQNITLNDFKSSTGTGINQNLEMFASLDDTDVLTSIKIWATHPDKVLSTLSQNLITRKLPRNLMQDTPFDPEMIEKVKQATAKLYNIQVADAGYFVTTNSIENSTYKPDADKILIKEKNGHITEIVHITDMINIKALTAPVSKYFLCFPKEVDDVIETRFT